MSTLAVQIRTYIQKYRGTNTQKIKQNARNLGTEFSFFPILCFYSKKKQTWCLWNLMFFQTEKKYICFYITTTKCLQKLTPFKTCLILLSTWYGNQCRMLNLFCVSSVFGEDVVYHISTHSQNFNRIYFLQIRRGIFQNDIIFLLIYHYHTVI